MSGFIRVIGDGAPCTTQILFEQDGETFQVNGVKRVAIYIDAEQDTYTVSLTFSRLDFDVSKELG